MSTGTLGTQRGKAEGAGGQAKDGCGESRHALPCLPCPATLLHPRMRPLRPSGHSACPVTPVEASIILTHTRMLSSITGLRATPKEWARGQTVPFHSAKCSLLASVPWQLLWVPRLSLPRRALAVWAQAPALLQSSLSVGAERGSCRQVMQCPDMVVSLREAPGLDPVRA